MSSDKSKTCDSHCATPTPYEDIKSTTVPSSNVPTDGDVTRLESERKNCLTSGINIYENSYECKLNGGSVRFIQRICVPSACKHVYRNENLDPSTTKPSTEPESSNIINKYQNENIKQSPITADKNNNHDVLMVKDKRQANDKVVMQRETQATIEDILSLGKEPTFFSTRINDSNACDGCQNAGVLQSQLIDNTKPTAKQADHFKTKEYSRLNQQPTANDQGDEHKMAKEKTVSNGCFCGNTDLEQLQLTNNYNKRKSDSKHKNKNVEHPSQIQSVIAADQNNEMIILNEEAVSLKDKAIKQKNEESKKEKNPKKNPTLSTTETCACNSDSQSWNIEQSQLLHNDKAEEHFKIKNKDLNTPPKQSLILTDQNHELLIMKEKKATKGKVIVQKGRKVERGRSPAKGPKTSSVGICEPAQQSHLVDNDISPAKQKDNFKRKDVEHQLPNQHLIAIHDNNEVSKQQKNKSLKAKEKTVSNGCACQTSDSHQPQTLDHDIFPTKLKSNFKDAEDSSQVHSLIAADQNYELLIVKDETVLPKGKAKKPASHFTEICACKDYENSDIDQSPLISNDKPKDYFEIKNKDQQHTLATQFLIATDQNNELLIVKEEKDDKSTQISKKPEIEKDLAEGTTFLTTGTCGSNICNDCQNFVVQYSQLVDKPPEIQKGDFKHEYVEHPLLAGDEKRNEYIEHPLLEADEQRNEYVEHPLLAADGKRKVPTQRDKPQKKKIVGSGCTRSCQSSDSDQMVNSEKLSEKPDTGFKFRNKDIEPPSPKQSLIVTEQSHEKLILSDLEKRPKKKNPKKIKSLTKRPTFSSIGFLLKHLGKFRNPQLTKTEIARYETRKRHWDRPSAGELPKFGFYGTKEKKLFNVSEIYSMLVYKWTAA